VDADRPWVETLLNATELALTELRALAQPAPAELLGDLEQLRSELLERLAQAEAAQ
jgi:hypothetical protein